MTLKDNWDTGDTYNADDMNALVTQVNADAATLTDTGLAGAGSPLEARAALGILIREVGDTSIPGGFPAGGIIFTKQPSVLKKWSGIGVPDGTVVSTSTLGAAAQQWSGDTGFSVVTGTLTWRSASSALEIANNTTTAIVTWTGLAGAAKAFRFYFRTATAPATAINILRSSQFSLSIGSNASFQFRNAAGSFVADSLPMTLDSTYRIDVVHFTDTNTARVNVYDLAGSLFWTTTQATGTGDVDAVEFGRLGSVAFGPAYLSHFAVTDTAADIGPYESGITL